MKTGLIKALCGFALVSLLFACASQIAPSAELGGKYRKDFNSALRWKQFKVAAGHMKPEHSKAFLATFDELRDIDIVDVREVSVETFDENRRIEVTIEIEYYLLPSVTVKTFRFDQIWEFQGDETQSPIGYFIVSPFPEFP